MMMIENMEYWKVKLAARGQTLVEVKLQNGKTMKLMSRQCFSLYYVSSQLHTDEMHRGYIFTKSPEKINSLENI